MAGVFIVLFIYLSRLFFLFFFLRVLFLIELNLKMLELRTLLSLGFLVEGIDGTEAFCRFGINFKSV